MNTMNTMNTLTSATSTVEVRTAKIRGLLGILLLLHMLFPPLATPQVSQVFWNGYITTNVHSAVQVDAVQEVPAIAFTALAATHVAKAMMYVSATTGSPSGRMEIIRSYGINHTVTVTYDDTANTLQATGHPFLAGVKIAVGAQTTLPAGISGPTTIYYVCNTDLTANSFGIGTGYSGGDCTGRVTDFSGSSGTQSVREIVDSTGLGSSSMATISGAGWPEGTFANTATLSVGTSYALLLWNIAGTPGSNHFSIRKFDNGTTPWGPSQTTYHSSTGRFVFSSTGGATWGSLGTGFFRIEFGNGTYLGVPIESVATSTGVATGDRIYGTNEVGLRLTTPTSGLKVRGVTTCFSKVGTPTAGLQFKIYSGSDGAETLAGTTGAILPIEVTNTNVGCMDRYFSSTLTFTSGTVLRVMGSPTAGGDTSSNAYSLGIWTIKNDANSKALMGGNYVVVYNGSTWTSATEKWSPIALILDFSDPFPASSGAAGSVAHSDDDD